MNLEEKVLEKLKTAKQLAKEGKSLETAMLVREIKEHYDFKDSKKHYNIINKELLDELWRIKNESYYMAMKNRLKDAKESLYKAKFEEAKINCYDALGFAIELFLIPKKYRGGL